MIRKLKQLVIAFARANSPTLVNVAESVSRCSLEGVVRLELRVPSGVARSPSPVASGWESDGSRQREVRSLASPSR